MCDFLKKYATLEDIEIDREGYIQWLKIQEKERSRVADNRQILIKWRKLREEEARRKKGN